SVSGRGQAEHDVAALLSLRPEVSIQHPIHGRHTLRTAPKRDDCRIASGRIVAIRKDNLVVHCRSTNLSRILDHFALYGLHHEYRNRNSGKAQFVRIEHRANFPMFVAETCPAIPLSYGRSNDYCLHCGVKTRRLETSMTVLPPRYVRSPLAYAL